MSTPSTPSAPDSPETAKALAALAAHHTFPGPYTFKAIGPNDAQFTAAVLAAVVAVLGARRTPAPKVTTRPSARGNHLAVHVQAQLQSAGQVLDIYAILRGVRGLKMLL